MSRRRNHDHVDQSLDWFTPKNNRTCLVSRVTGHVSGYPVYQDLAATEISLEQFSKGNEPIAVVRATRQGTRKSNGKRGGAARPRPSIIKVKTIPRPARLALQGAGDG